METYEQTIFYDMHTCISLADDIDFTFDSHLIIFGYVSIQLNHFKEEQVHKLEPCIEMCIFSFFFNQYERSTINYYYYYWYYY